MRLPTVEGLPEGFTYGVTRYADVILERAFPDRFRDLQGALDRFSPTLDELRVGGGGRTVFVRRFDDSLREIVTDGRKLWGSRNITIEKQMG
ncbi:MAG: hypothetical protein OXG89_03340, partial [bacterium]|nr:hypothetical protein [bacterium]